MFHVCNFLSSKCAARNIIIRVSIEPLWAAHFPFCSIFVNVFKRKIVLFFTWKSLIFFKCLNLLSSNLPLCNCSSKSFIKLNCWHFFLTKSAKNQVAGATKKYPSLWSLIDAIKNTSTRRQPVWSYNYFCLTHFFIFFWIIVFGIFFEVKLFGSTMMTAEPFFW